MAGRPIDRRRLAEALRQACLDAALEGYENAARSGLCHEGAWEVAVGAIRSLDVRALADRFAPPGPPAAVSGAASTGSIAAWLLEWAASLCERQGPREFSKRARAIARRAAVLRAALVSTAEESAPASHAPSGSGVSSEARRRATGALLEIAGRCAQIAALAVEVAAHGHRATRSDTGTARRLASTAAACALDLAGESLRSGANERWVPAARRRACRTRLLLRSAAPSRRRKGKRKP